MTGDETPGRSSDASTPDQDADARDPDRSKPTRDRDRERDRDRDSDSAGSWSRGSDDDGAGGLPRGGLGGFLRGVFRPRNGEGSLRETLEDLIEEREEADLPITDHERLLLTNILRLRDVAVEDIMIPRADIIAVEVATPMDAVMARIGDSGHSRLPVYRDTLDNVLGMVHVKDLVHLPEGETPPLERVVREILYASPSARVLDLMLEMRLRRTHMALIVDEYGGVDGLVTIEDLVEQIVGEIEDEHDLDEDPELVILADGRVEADARVTLETFEETIGAVLTEEEREEVDTLGGLVFRIAGRVPARGELILRDGGLEFEIVDADPRRIRRLRIRGLPSGESEA